MHIKQISRYSIYGLMALVVCGLAACSNQTAVSNLSSPIQTPGTPVPHITPEFKVTAQPVTAIPEITLIPQAVETPDPNKASVKGTLVSLDQTTTPVSGTTIFISQVVGDLTNEQAAPAVYVQFNVDRLGIADEQGRFVVTNIPPGQYAVVAVPYMRAGEFFQINVPKAVGGPYLVLKPGQTMDLGQLAVTFNAVKPPGFK